MADAKIFIMNELLGKEHGPYSLPEIEKLIYRKKLKKKHLVRKSDYSKWFRAGELLGKVFDGVDRRRVLEAEQAKEAKTQKKRRKQHLKEVKAAAREKAESHEPYEISESDNDILTSYLAAKNEYQEGLKALTDDPTNSDLNRELVDRAENLLKMTRLAQSSLPEEPIQDFDVERFQQDLANLGEEESDQP